MAESHIWVFERAAVLRSMVGRRLEAIYCPGGASSSKEPFKRERNRVGAIWLLCGSVLRIYCEESHSDGGVEKSLLKVMENDIQAVMRDPAFRPSVSKVDSYNLGDGLVKCIGQTVVSVTVRKTKKSANQSAATEGEFLRVAFANGHHLVFEQDEREPLGIVFSVSESE